MFARYCTVIIAALCIKITHIGHLSSESSLLSILLNILIYVYQEKLIVFCTRHTGNGAVIVRCSQPEVGWLGWRSSEDEDLLKAISDACSFDGNFRMNYDRESTISHSPGSHQSDESVQITNHTPQNKKVNLFKLIKLQPVQNLIRFSC